MSQYIELPPSCRHYGSAVNDFIQACSNSDAMPPVEHWRTLHLCLSRLYAVAVEYSLVHGVEVDLPACLRRRSNLDDALKKCELRIEPVIQWLSGAGPRGRIPLDSSLHELMAPRSEPLTALLKELRCSLLIIYDALLVGYSWWLEGHPDDQVRACECWRDAFEKGWGTPALTFLGVASTLSSAQGSTWRHDDAM